MSAPRSTLAVAQAGEESLRRAAAALALVLDLAPGDLRADSPLADLGADSIALVQWADVAEATVWAEAGRRVALDDAVLATARTVGDLADHLTKVSV